MPILANGGSPSAMRPCATSLDRAYSSAYDQRRWPSWQLTRALCPSTKDDDEEEEEEEEEDEEDEGVYLPAAASSRQSPIV